MKKLIRDCLGLVGLEIRRTAGHNSSAPDAGGAGRPIGNVRDFLQDVKARGFSPRGIIDAGANWGNWTRLVSAIFPETPVIMIEPQAEMEVRLGELVKRLPNCHYIKAGAGSHEGELIQTIWKDLAGSSFLPPTDPAKVKNGEQRKTPITTIDAILKDSLHGFEPDLIKLDVQGFELEALTGAESVFGRTELFIIETSLFRFMPGMPLAREVISFMSNRGYELYDITEYLRRPLDGALGQVDFAFVKSDGFFLKSNKWC